MNHKKEAIHRFLLAARSSTLKAFFFIFVYSTSFGQTNPYSSKFIRVDDYIDSLMKEWKVPGLALAIVYKDQLIYGRGYGYRDLEKKLPVETTTLFPIASNTKLITSTVATMLQEEGKLSIDIPVKKYHPNLNFYNDELNSKITLRDLLSHRTGLPGYNSIWINTPFTRDELVSKIVYMKPSLGFREGYIYNNMMFVTAGSVLEKITASKWEDLIREKIFIPLGMNASCFTIDEMKKYGNYSLAYFEDDSTKQLKLKQFVAQADALGPAGTIKSTVEDMSRWMIVQLNSGKIGGQQVIPAKAINQTLVPNSIADKEGRWPELSNGLYGLGRIIQTYKGLKITNHTGSIDGYYSNLTFVPEKELAVFIVYNAVEAGSLRTVINLPVIDRLLDLSPTPWISRYKTDYLRDKARSKQLEDSVKATQVKNTNPSHALQAYTGTYSHPAYGEIKIQIQNNRLVFIFRSQQSLLYHFHYNQFVTKEERNDIPNFRISFIVNNKGAIDRLTSEPYGDALAEFVRKL